jgi:hypothetical protein
MDEFGVLHAEDVRDGLASYDGLRVFVRVELDGGGMTAPVVSVTESRLLDERVALLRVERP